MEVISRNDIIKQVKNTWGHSEMNLLINEHKICICYSHRGKTILATMDGNDSIPVNAVGPFLDRLTENKRFKIKMINPESECWKKIRIGNDELKEAIEVMLGHHFPSEKHSKGSQYFSEALYEISIKHIHGNVVDIERILKNVAKSNGVKIGAIETGIRLSVLGEVNKFFSNLSDEYKKYFTISWRSTRLFVRHFSYYLLDCLYENKLGDTNI